MKDTLSSRQTQPGSSTVVWQHNRLAEARYELSAREQKLLLYVIAMIESDDADFKRYEVNVGEFAQLANLSKDNLYRELRELAEKLKTKVLVVPNHFDAETGKVITLITSWFSDAFISPNGKGYFAVEISRNLKPYLLQVKRDFYQFQLQQVMTLRSAYAIRLYQWAKRWQFRSKVEVPMIELRGIMGAGETNNLALYGDFKRRAIQPAVIEINEKSDLSLRFSEIKAKGSKAVESLVFSIRSRPSHDVEVLALPPPPQLEFALDEDPQIEERLLSEVKAKYGLSQTQAERIRKYLTAKGAAFIREKMLIVDAEPRENVARALLAALRDDWQPPLKISKNKPKVEKAIRADEETLRRQAKALAEFKKSL